jgi:hypothetical protein
MPVGALAHLFKVLRADAAGRAALAAAKGRAREGERGHVDDHAERSEAAQLGRSRLPLR